MKPARRFATGAALLACCAAQAHESLTALLQLQERAPQVFDSSWHLPAAQGGTVPRIAPRLPDDCRLLDAPREQAAPAAWLTQGRVRCELGLRSGQRIAFDGQAGTLVDVLVRIERADGSAQSLLARPRSPQVEIAQGRPSSTQGYFALGVEHIAFGLDHLLFVFCLVLLVRGIGPLFRTVTAFTLAHSASLALAALGTIHVPRLPVESTIALSIVFLARELTRTDGTGVARRAPWIVALGFGLLHGLGFAGALAEVGLPAHAVVPALLLFNLGVEAGQLAFVGLVLGTATALRGRPWLAGPSPVPAYAVGGVSAFWWLQRTSGLLGT